MGAAEARLFAAEGARVVLSDIDMTGEAIAKEIGAPAMFINHDVADAAAWERVVNQAVIASMSAAGGGSIINISSLGGMTGFPGVFAYQATKWVSRSEADRPHLHQCLGGQAHRRLDGDLDGDRSHLPRDSRAQRRLRSLFRQRCARRL
jgi:NADP-dependent 3-hydroxy acid dehydrogenase YdfG